MALALETASPMLGLCRTLVILWDLLKTKRSYKKQQAQGEINNKWSHTAF
jgi:hypothetical protein